MKKYRARLSSGRVIGPFNLEEMEELFRKTRFSGKEEFQEFPTGDWASLEAFSELKKARIQKSLSNEDGNEATFVKKLKDFDFTKVDHAESEGYFPAEFEYQEPQKALAVEQPLTVETNETENQGEEDEDLDLPADELETTELRTLAAKNLENFQDKTVISPDTIKHLEKLKRKEKLAEEEKKSALLEKAKNERDKVDLDNDSTQSISLDSLKETVEAEVVKSELELTEEAKKAKIEAKKSEKRKIREARVEVVEEEDEAPSSSKRLMIGVALILMVLLMLLPGEEKPQKRSKVQLVYPQILFPQQYETPDPAKASELYKRGVLEHRKGTYPAQIQAANFLRASLENQFKDNPAAAKLILYYSDLLKHSNIKIEDANRVFKLIQIFNAKALSDPTMAAGMALFYLSIDKAPAAVKTIEKYNTIKKNKPTLELFSIFLRALVANGDLVKAKAVEEKLASVKEKNLFVYKSLFDYYISLGNYQTASSVLVDYEKKRESHVSMMLRKANLLVYKEDFSSLAILLKKIRALEAEKSKIYYSKYLEFKGLLAVSKNDPEGAAKFFKEALNINENLALRSKLSSLSANSNQETNELINQSKAVKLIANSESHLKRQNFKFAFKDALDASRIAPDFLPAQLHLAKLQIVQSFFSEAIATLEKLYDQHPHNPKVVFGLIDAYIEAFKFDKVQKMLSILSGSDLRNDPEYFSKTAKYYVYKDEFAGAVAWLQKAINVNPLNDENIYELSKMFIRHRKYNQAKILLNKAMDLDPANVEYRVSYADILYETENANSAIGYLYDVLRDFPDNGKILSAIGIYYYRSGQVKMFQSVKEKLLKLPGKDTALFEFLIKAAKIDEKYDDVVKYSKELIELNPGDLRARLFLGQIYMEMSKYKEALAEFNAIKERLETYPKLQYFLSRLYLLTDNVEKATELATKEIEGNPGGIEGYLLLGEIYKKKEKYIEAEKQFKLAQQINPKNVDVLVGLAYINFMKSQYEIALDLFKKARRFEPARAETHKLLGDVYRKIGQSSLAVESYQMFLELSPNSRYKENLQNYIKMMQ